MRHTSEISTDGPYLRVLLPDVLPPDWEALRRKLEPEVVEGVTRATVILGNCAGITPGDPDLEDMLGSLRSAGVDTLVVC